MSSDAREPRSCRRSFLSLDDLLEAAEAVVPGAAVALQPIVDVFEPPRAEIAVPRPAVLLARDQLSVLEDPHVLLQARQRHAGRPSELADRRRPVAEPLENGPAGRVGQRSERAVHGRILNHTVQYDEPATTCQAAREEP